MKRILFAVIMAVLVSCTGGAAKFDVLNGIKASGDVEEVQSRLEKSRIKEYRKLRQSHMRSYNGPFFGINDCHYTVFNIPGEAWLDQHSIKHAPGIGSPVWHVSVSNTEATAAQVEKVVKYYQSTFKKYAGDWVDNTTADGNRVRGGEFWMGEDYQILIKSIVSNGPDDLTMFHIDHVFWNVPGADLASMRLNK